MGTRLCSAASPRASCTCCYFSLQHCRWVGVLLDHLRLCIARTPSPWPLSQSNRLVGKRWPQLSSIPSCISTEAQKMEVLNDLSSDSSASSDLVDNNPEPCYFCPLILAIAFFYSCLTSNSAPSSICGGTSQPARGPGDTLFFRLPRVCGAGPKGLLCLFKATFSQTTISSCWILKTLATNQLKFANN